MRWGPGAWLARLPSSWVARLAIAFNVVIMLLVVAVIAVNLLGQRERRLEVARQQAQAVVYEQGRQISDHVQAWEYALGQLEARLNVARALGGMRRNGVQDLLREFQQLIPDSLDLLLLQRDGQVLAASTIVSGPQQFSSFCRLLPEYRPEVTRDGIVVFSGSYPGRCPPDGTLIYGRPLRSGAAPGNESLWLLLRADVFQRVLDQHLTVYGVGWHYTIHGRDRLLASGAGGVAGGAAPARHYRAAGGPVIEARHAVAGTPVRLELTVDADALLRRDWLPQALRMVVLGIAFLLLWGGASFFIVRMVQRHHRALQESEARFDLSLDYAGVGAWEWDMASGRLYWTRRCWPMFGFGQAREHLSYEEFLERVHPEDRAAVQQAMQDCLQQGQPYEVGYRVIRPDASVHQLRASGNVKRDETGQPLGMYGVLQDVTHQSDLARELQAIMDNVADAIITIDQHGVITSFNHAATTIFGYRASEAVGQNVSLLMPQPYNHEHDAYLQRYQATDERRILGIGREVQGLHKSGRVFPIHLTVSSLEHEGHPMYVGLIRDITESKRAEAEIQRLAYSDQLTGLANRRLLMDRLEHALAACQRSGEHGALIFVDIDQFKHLNDAHGHATGDQLLRQVAHRMSDAVRDSDTVARQGGDEFVVLIEGLEKKLAVAATQAEVVARKLTQAFKPAFQLQGRDHHVTASFGIAMFGPDSRQADVLMAQADMAMYQAKAQGRNGYRFFDEALQQAQVARTEMVHAMREGLRSGGYFLVYQPQVDDAGRVFGAEALLRWRHPERGLVSPAEFIPLAEQSDLIIDLGGWVLEAACRQLALWSDTPGMAGLTLAVNVSASQFKHEGFVRQVIGALEGSGVDAARLKLELTESALADDVDKLAQKMQLLKGLGVSFSLDDFGTGYSSLSYLKRLPIDQLKIDRSFVTDVHRDPNSTAIARTVVALGQSLGMNVIAEGVETIEQVEGLRQIGCHAYQGYHFSRPLSDAQLHDFVVRA